MRWSRMFEQAFAGIATRPYEEELELPTSLDGEMSNTESKKTQARRDFEDNPALFLGYANRGFSNPMNLDLDGTAAGRSSIVFLAGHELRQRNVRSASNWIRCDGSRALETSECRRKTHPSRNQTAIDDATYSGANESWDDQVADRCCNLLVWQTRNRTEMTPPKICRPARTKAGATIRVFMS